MYGLRDRLRSALIGLVRHATDGLRDVAGAAGLEFAAVAPILLIAGIGTIDIGFATYRNTQVQNAARAGAEYARLHKDDPFDAAAISAISDAVVNATNVAAAIVASPAPAKYCGCASSTGITTTDCSQQCPGGSTPGKYVTVSAQATYTTIIPYPFFDRQSELSGRSTIRIE